MVIFNKRSLVYCLSEFRVSVIVSGLRNTEELLVMHQLADRKAQISRMRQFRTAILDDRISATTGQMKIGQKPNSTSLIGQHAQRPGLFKIQIPPSAIIAVYHRRMNPPV